jgi:hypothetical protein
VLRLAQLVVTKAGLRGLVCSPLEIVRTAKNPAGSARSSSRPASAPAKKKPTTRSARCRRERSNCRGRKLAGDWTPDLRGGKSARGGGENFGVTKIITRHEHRGHLVIGNSLGGEFADEFLNLFRRENLSFALGFN